MPISHHARQWLSRGPRTLDTDRQERTLAILVGARSLIGRGWLRGGWYVLEAPNGRRRFVGAGSLTPHSYGAVVQACLVGAVVEASTWHSAEQGTAGPALDVLWRALMDAQGKRFDPGRVVPSPAARRLYVRDLTRWNDYRDRTQDDVLRLLDATIGQVMADRSTAPADDAPVGALQATR
jgi:hypothetical protein